jgi:hypothetical protein
VRRTVRALAWLYGRALRLYPRAHRREYDSEMQSVFERAAEDADRRGLLSLLNLCLRELRDLPGAIVRAHSRDLRRNAEGTTMAERAEDGGVQGNLQVPAGAAPGSWVDRPCPWVGTLVGLIPFLYVTLWSIVLELLASPPPPWQLIAYVGPLIAGYALLLAGLGLGWARGFPRWSYAYLLSVPLFSLYVAFAASSAILPYAYLLCLPLLSALVPLAVMAIAVLVVTRSRPPLAPLFTNVWRDWTRLSFALYGLVPMLLWFAFDEVEDRSALPFILALMLILAGGALAYLRSARLWQRAIALLVSTALARAMATAGTRIYWNAHPQPWMAARPVRWYSILRVSSTGVTLLLAFLFAPALLGLLRRWTSPPRAA